jgi:hypothetical protein
MSLINGTEIYDNSELEIFKTCPYKYYASMVAKRQARNDRKTAAEFGQAMHIAIQDLFRGGDKESAIALAEAYFRPHEDPSDAKRTIGRLDVLIDAYVDNYGQCGRDVYDVLDIESGFILPLHEDIMYAGRLDMRVCEKTTNRTYLWDIKTTWDLFSFVARPNDQFTGYLWAAREMYRDIDRLIVDLVGVYKSKPERGKRGDWLEGKRPSDVLVRMVTERTGDELDAWQRDTIRWIDWIHQCHDTGVWPRNSQSCKRFNRPCPFQIVCSTDERTGRELLDDDDLYTDRTWIAFPDLHTGGSAS